MRILIACSWSLPHAGGVSTYVNQLLTGLQRAGHQVHTFSPTPDGQGFHIPERNAVIDKNALRPLLAHQTYSYTGPHIPNLDPWITYSEIERYTLEAAASYFGVSDYDVIHAQDIVSAHAISRVKPPHVALVTTIHGCLAKEWFVKLKEMGLPEQDTTSPLWFYSVMREHIGATVGDITIAPSNWLKELLVNEFSVPENRVIVSHYGIDIDKFLLSMNREPITIKPASKTVLLCPARFDVVKGHIHLVHALARLKEERTDWVCWLAGDGSLREAVMQAVSELGLDEQILFLGNRADIPQLIGQADFVVLPSIQDNQPFAVIEAQVAGKPLIVSDAGGIPEMLPPPFNQHISRAGDSEQLYLSIKNALDHADASHVTALSAKEWALQHWSLQHLTERMLDLYGQTISKRPARSQSAAPLPEPLTSANAELQSEAATDQQPKGKAAHRKWKVRKRRRSVFKRRKRSSLFGKRRRARKSR
ncbi:glycosyltransferase family 4 protein [Paenibacillus sp. NPDC058071]|uniref:glycosyltransferase family 4 protein n=1 Tax=Paenibacillus sp. NPDC058071 TaxID=3346326 RepID=UPI0036DA98FF